MIEGLAGHLMYPFKFEPILKEMVWGGELLTQKYGRQNFSSKIGESWDVSCHKNGESVIINGKFSGQTLKSVISKFPLEILGAVSDFSDEFPLLIKLIHANEVLSVQVHPPDEYAQIHEGEPYGKTEMWYVLDAEIGSELVYGLKEGIDKDSFLECLEKDCFEKCLNVIRVEAGDAIFIPAGLVHAIGKDIVLCEIQQNSDLTYRVHDWNRTGIDGMPRKLHIEQSLDVISFDSLNPPAPIKGLVFEEIDFKKTYLVCCKYFEVEKVDIYTKVIENTRGIEFHTLTFIKGEGEVVYSHGSVCFQEGDSILIPAVLGEYQINGNCSVLKASVPKNPQDLITMLLNKGFTLTQIKDSIVGIV